MDSHSDLAILAPRLIVVAEVVLASLAAWIALSKSWKTISFKKTVDRLAHPFGGPR